MDIAFENAVKHELMQNETLLWAGQPNTRKVFNITDLFYVPLSLLWLGCSLYWTIYIMPHILILGIFGIPYVLIGLFLTFGRLIVKILRKRHTVYVLTDRHIIILIFNLCGAVKSFSHIPLEHIDQAVLTMSRNKIGTIFFDTQPYGGAMHGHPYYIAGGLHTLFFPPGFNLFKDMTGCPHEETRVFMEIDGAKEVYELYTSARNRQTDT